MAVTPKKASDYISLIEAANSGEEIRDELVAALSYLNDYENDFPEYEAIPISEINKICVRSTTSS